ncbi:MAG: T9SS type A sorting domain-containing protein [Flavobacteriales bacterium]|nr:T9SS type A sorting domain-containing protein [Flavobacteriales bacterium]
MRLKIKFTFFTATLLLFSLNAQHIDLIRNDQFLVIETSDTLKLAWGGALNYPQFSAADVNYDGWNDLVIFDRTGNKITCLINQGVPGKPEYLIGDEFRYHFPSITDWMLMADYDGDGKHDLFHYWNGSVQAHRNTGNASIGIQFSLVKEQIRSQYGLNQLPLYVSSADFPAITDVDGDSDLDILTFNFLGGCVEFHQNRSMELYGHRDSLVFTLRTDNWGNFVEGASATDIYLNDSCDAPGGGIPGGMRHSGSSLLALDMDGDSDKDLVLGDIGANFLTYLHNDGTPAQANMGAFELNFPQNHIDTQPVNLTTFPTAFYVDVNNDYNRDLIVAPNAPSSSETRNGVWRYSNIGTDNQPNFIKLETNFIQGEMIDLGEGAFPTWVDFNRDGLLDLVIGNAMYFNGYGQLALYQNTGSASQPQFELITRDLAGISSLNLTNIVPAFGDLDSDGDDDLLIGETSGYIHFFENIAPVAPNTPAVFASPVMQYFNIKENSFSAPAIVDLNLDGLNDIVCGSRMGKLNFYQNTGTLTTPNFNPTASNPAIPTISQLGGVNVVDPTISSSGYSVPSFFQYNGNLHLAVGSLKGGIHHYNQLHDATNQINTQFNLLNSNWGFMYPGFRGTPAVADITNDNIPDLVVGNYAGGVSLYVGQVGFSELNINSTQTQIQVFPNPFSIHFNIQFPGKIFHFTIRDLNGRIIQISENVFHEVVLYSENWAPGIYLLEVSSDSARYFLKLVHTN